MGQRRNKAKWSMQERDVEWFRVGDSKVISERDFNRLSAGHWPVFVVLLLFSVLLTEWY